MKTSARVSFLQNNNLIFYYKAAFHCVHVFTRGCLTSTDWTEEINQRRFPCERRRSPRAHLPIT